MKNIIYLIFIGSFFNIKSMQDDMFVQMTAYDSPNKKNAFKKELDNLIKAGAPLSPQAKYRLLNKSQMLPFTDEFKKPISKNNNQ